MNYHQLTAAQKTTMKNIVAELRKVIYATGADLTALKNGISVNFGKGREARYIVSIKLD